MKKTFYIFLTLSYNFCFSQFAIVNDTDGFVNVRSSPKIENNISDKLDNGFIIYLFESQGNWIKVDYKKSGKDLHGYIYKDKIKYITDFKNIPLKSNLNGKAILIDENVKVEITETKFNKTKHVLKFLKGNSGILETINNLRILGTDGEIPKREYKSIDLEIKNIKTEIPNNALQNLYEPTLENTEANYDEINDILYIQSSNSDGAGGYEVLWIIEKNKFKNRIEEYDF